MAASYMDRNPSGPVDFDDEDLAFVLQTEEIERAERYDNHVKKSSSQPRPLFESLSQLRGPVDRDVPRFAPPPRPRDPPAIVSRTFRPPVSQTQLPLNDSDYIVLDDVDEPAPTKEDHMMSDYLFAQRLQQEEMQKLNARQRAQNEASARVLEKQPSASSLNDQFRNLATISSSSLSRNRNGSSRAPPGNPDRANDRILNFALSEADLFSSSVDVDDINVNTLPRSAGYRARPPTAGPDDQITQAINMVMNQRLVNQSRRRGPASRVLHQIALTDGDFSSNDYETLLSLDDAVKSKKGLTKAELDQLPSYTFKASMSNEAGDNECSVCFDNFQSREKITILVCSHKFHHKCIKPWLKENRSCPLCKKDAITGVEPVK